MLIDRDPDAIADARRRFGQDARVWIRQANFADLGLLARELDLAGKIDGVLLDLGVSSPQLSDPERGFSFQADGPLDMRMDPAHGEPASAWLARVSETELAAVLREFGEEPRARRIARVLVRARRKSPIERTGQLADLIVAAVGGAHRPRHPATRSFQAIRIAVNAELGALDAAIESGIDVLAPGGRLVVISFHSLEDRRVKRAFVRAARPPPASRRVPAATGFRPRLRLIGKARVPSAQELKDNPRARSATLRAAERLAESAP